MTVFIWFLIGEVKWVSNKLDRMEVIRIRMFPLKTRLSESQAAQEHTNHNVCNAAAKLQQSSFHQITRDGVESELCF